jgi:phosphoribosylformylglycinamidine synthase
VQSDGLRAGVLRMEGTNNEEEAYLSLQRSGFIPDYIHIFDLNSGRKNLLDYDVLLIPGGFSAGDYIRAGAIFAARLRAYIRDLQKFNDLNRVILGICNGFQVLSELGMLPDTGNKMERSMVLAVNESNRFECRYTYFNYTSRNKIFESAFRDRIMQVPVAHLEGRVLFKNENILDEVLQNDQILFKYTNPDGTGSGYPWNPNGSVMDIAGISNENGNVIGLMPHPERVYYNFQMMPDGHVHEKGTGEYFFKAIYNYTKKLFD